MTTEVQYLRNGTAGHNLHNIFIAAEKLQIATICLHL